MVGLAEILFAPDVDMGKVERIVGVYTILIAAEEEFGAPVAKIIGPGRVRALVEARAYCAVWMRVALRMSYASIGAVLGGRDHETIMALCGKLSDRTPFWLKTGAA